MEDDHRKKGSVLSETISFDNIGLRPEVLQGIQDLQYIRPNDHQTMAIPACIKGNDVVLVEVAGSGKTVATVISLLNKLDLSLATCQVIHLTPYRECSKWTQKLYQTLGSHLNFTSHACVGGTKVRKDIEILKEGVQIVVSTPGRLLDMLHRQAIDTSDLRCVVVDEIHDIVDYKGMEEPTLDIFKLLKQKVQVIVVASHISKDAQSVIDEITSQPVYVRG